MKEFAALKVSELKNECRARGLKVSGVKKELVDRLKAHSRKNKRAAAKQSLSNAVAATSLHEAAKFPATLLAEKLVQSRALGSKCALTEELPATDALSIETPLSQVPDLGMQQVGLGDSEAGRVLAETSQTAQSPKSLIEMCDCYPQTALNAEALVNQPKGYLEENDTSKLDIVHVEDLAETAMVASPEASVTSCADAPEDVSSLPVPSSERVLEDPPSGETSATIDEGNPQDMHTDKCENMLVDELAETAVGASPDSSTTSCGDVYKDVGSDALAQADTAKVVSITNTETLPDILATSYADASPLEHMLEDTPIGAINAKMDEVVVPDWLEAPKQLSSASSQQPEVKESSAQSAQDVSRCRSSVPASEKNEHMLPQDVPTSVPMANIAKCEERIESDSIKCNKPKPLPDWLASIPTATRRHDFKPTLSERPSTTPEGGTEQSSCASPTARSRSPFPSGASNRVEQTAMPSKDSLQGRTSKSLPDKSASIPTPSTMPQARLEHSPRARISCRSRSPLPCRAESQSSKPMACLEPSALASPVQQEGQNITPSKFASVFERLKAKAEATERGEATPSGWTPRVSAVRSEIQRRLQTPPRTPIRSPAAVAPQRTPIQSPATIASPGPVRRCIDMDCGRANAPSSPEAPRSKSASSSALASTPQAKKSSAIEDKIQLLENLTEQMKRCMLKLQDQSLEETSVVKLRNLMKTIRKQMDNVSCIRDPQNSPAFSRSPGLLCSPAHRHGGC